MSKILKIRLDWRDYETILLFDSEENGTVAISNYEEETWIHGLYVVPSARNKGLATSLLNEAEKYSTHKSINISVIDDAEQWLIDFYRKRNYIITNEQQ